MNFSKEDKKWIEKCKKYPNKYKIYVDNDEIFVTDIKKNQNESVYTFDTFDYDFIVQILNYIGCNADWV